MAAPVAVRVAVDARADRPERTFSYLLPPAVDAPSPGSLLLVPYGRRLALGYLIGEDDGPVAADLKQVEAVVSEPMLTPDLLRLAAEIAGYYRAPIGATLAAMLPPGLESRVERRWRVERPDDLPPELRGLAEAGGGWIGNAELLRHAPRRGSITWLERLRRSGAVSAVWSLRGPQVGPRRVRVVRRAAPGDAPRRAPLQRAILETLGAAERPLSDVAAELGVEPASVLAPARRLAAAGLVELAIREVERDPLAHRAAAPALRHEMVEEQRAALDAIAGLAAGAELLLEGVAASGKSDVYLAAAAETLAAGRGVIMLVPELSMVPQLADRAAAVAGDALGVLHSGLSAGERHDQWWRIVRGETRLVVGTRTAVFAPLAELGLIVVDEEHDGGYKSDRSPRYDARWVARRRAVLTGARVVAGSATPDLLTLSRVRGGHVERAHLRGRRVGLTPRIEVVDLRAELAAGNRSILSATLAEALASLVPGNQAILLVNRRGASTFILCRDCGESVRCPDCDLPFVFHLDGGTLRCHHCGRSAPPPQHCPRCDSGRVRYFGIGTQRVEAELGNRYPALRVGRLDSDALSARRGFESVYDDFRDGRLDVLVGTQLAAKGLDLPSVTLAGVVAADVTLNLPDFRAAERTWQLLAQVAGRAGRGSSPGHVVIQTYAPEHYAVRAAAALDADGFADQELTRRRLLGYPPFSLLARLVVADADRERAAARGRRVADAVAGSGVEVLGPLPAYVARRAGRWRFQIVLRAPHQAARAAALERVPAGVTVDVDPESLL